jgi:hypothetical protein
MRHATVETDMDCIHLEMSLLEVEVGVVHEVVGI